VVQSSSVKGPKPVEDGSLDKGEDAGTNGGPTLDVTTQTIKGIECIGYCVVVMYSWVETDRVTQFSNTPPRSSYHLARSAKKNRQNQHEDIVHLHR
jgi:hypothetical protein